MRTRLIFYQTMNTEVNEKIVRNSLARFGVTLGGTVSSDTPVELTRALSRAVEMSELILIVGGLDLPARDNTVRVLSTALGIPVEEAGRSRSHYRLSDSHRLPQPTLMEAEVLYSRLGGVDGIAVNSGTQCIICLPNHEAQLSDMLNGSAAECFSSIYGLTEASIRGVPAREDIFVEQPYYEPEKIPDNTLDLSHFGSVYNNEVITGNDPVKIHGKQNNSVVKIILKTSIGVAVAVLIIVMLYIGYHTYNNTGGDYTAQAVYNEARALYNAPAGKFQLPTGVLPQFEALYQENNDLKGWLAIPDTDIAYPIVQPSASADADYYTSNDFFNNASNHGALYFDRSNIIAEEQQYRNYVVYGGSLLAEINRYTDIAYFREHPMIQMDTIYKTQKWRVFSVAVVSGDTYNEFNYANTSFLGTATVENYLYQLFIRSLFYTAVDVFPTDNLLTIVADSHEFSGAKIIVAARAVREDEDLTGMYDGVLDNPFVLMPDVWYALHSETRPAIPGFEYANGEEPTTTVTKPKPTTQKKTTTLKTQATTKNKTTTKKQGSTTTSPSVPNNTTNKTMRITSNGRVMSGTILEILPKIVEAEMGAPFSAESLKAQAVASYTFYLYSGGAAKAPSFPTKPASKKSIEAVKAVLGKKMAYNGKTPYTPYYAISAGRTADNDVVNMANLPYLKSVDCSVDKKVSGFETVKKYSSADVAKKIKAKTGINLTGVSKEKWFVVNSRDSHDLYVKKVTVGGKKTYRGATLWSNILGVSFIRSPAYWITYNADSDTFTFRSRGYGGCVGMSQKGAGEYAKQGKDYVWILKHFYPGVEIK